MTPPRRPFRRVFRFALRRWRIADETDDEIRFHLERRIDRLVSLGWTRDDAEREALRRFGPYDQARTDLIAAAERREERLTMLERLDAIRHDVAYALRQIRRAPAFTTAVVGSFALGIGANATMFGIIDRLLLRAPAHVANPERIVEIGEMRHFAGEEYRSASFSYPAFKDYRDRIPAFAGIAAASYPRDMDLDRGEKARKVQGMLVTGSYLSLTGAHPALGRFFLPEEDREPDGAPVAVIGYGFWQREFDGASRALGATLDIGTQRYTIVGVAPRGFTGLQRAPVDVFIPITAGGSLRFGGNEWATSRGNIWLSLYARLRPTATIAQAEAQGTALRRGIVMDGGNPADSTMRASLKPVLSRDEKSPSAEVRVSKLLVGVSAVVLLIACANVASLLVARALRRRREIAVRLALGIGRARLMTQLVVESVVLALLGGVGALLVVRWGGALVRNALLGNYAWDDGVVDGRLLAYAGAIALAAGLLAGIIPALGASAADLTRALKEGAREGSPHRSGVRNALLLGQTALAVVLLIGTGLFVRSLRNVNAVELGMETNKVLVATMDLRAAGFAPAETQSMFEIMARRARSVSGIANAAIGGALPFNSSYATYLRVPGVDSLPRVSDGGPYVNAVTPEFFPTLGIHILRGRPITAADMATHARVMVVSESMARLVWSGRDPIGQCVGFDADSLPCTTVVGIAENTHRQRIIEKSEVLQYYVQLEYAPEFMRNRILFIRPVAGDPAHWVEPLRRILQTAAPNLPFADVRPMNMLLDREIRPWRLGATMFAVFGVLALVLTALGLYSVVAYGVAQRTHELGVRIALGAGQGSILRLIVRHGVALAITGTLLGIAIALASGRLVAPLLFEVSSHDAVTFVAVALVLVAVSILASVVPAMRASRVDPVVALRAD